jgi:effector-binding domain-containing protein
MSYDCQAVLQPAQPVLTIRTRSDVKDLPSVLGQAYIKLAAHLGQFDAMPAGAPFVAYYNMDMEDLDIEVGFPIAEEIKNEGDIQSSKLPEMKVATCTFTGPYLEIGPAYDELNAFMKENQYMPTGVVYEYYLNDPKETPPAELKTQIVFPLKS